MVPFGGWEMPLSYPSGTLAEHRACRSTVVAFDVSHLGTVRVTGRGAHDALQFALTNDLDKIGPGRAQYTHLLDPSDASVVDDIIVLWTKGGFRGRAPLEAEKERGIARRLRGLIVEGRQPPREGYAVLVDGKPAGEVTSGNFSPILEQGIAFAFVPPSLAPGDGVEVDMRGRAVPATVVKVPF